MSADKETWPEILFTVAEHSLNKSPVFLGLTGAQLSRIAREVYAQLRKSGHYSLARQAQALIDPSAVTQALQATVHQPLNLSSPKTGDYPVCPCCVSWVSPRKTDVVPPHPNPPTFLNVAPSLVAAQPCNFGGYVPSGQLHVMSNTKHMQQEMGVGNYTGNVCVVANQTAVPKSQTTLKDATAVVFNSGELAVPEKAPDGSCNFENGATRKFCIARLLFALVAAKVAAEYFRVMQASNGSRADGDGIGGVSMEGLVEAGKAVTASLWPRRGLLAVHEHIVKRLQAGVSAALAGNYSSLNGRKNNGDNEKDALPPIYMSHAPHGRKELTLHEKASTEEIRKLLNLRNANSADAIGFIDGKQNTVSENTSNTEAVQQVARPLSQNSFQKEAAAGKTETGDTLDEEFRVRHGSTAEPLYGFSNSALCALFGPRGVCKCEQSYVKRAREHQGSATLSTEDQLKFYGLYKRAVSGLCPSKRPSRLNIREFKKWVSSTS